MHLAPLESTINFRPWRRYLFVICALARDRNPDEAPTGGLMRMLCANFGRLNLLFIHMRRIRPSKFSGPASSKRTNPKVNGQPTGLFDNHTGMNGLSDRVISAFWFWMRTGSRFEPLRPFAEESVQIFAPPSSSKPALGLTNFSFSAIPA
jgi:hypothetical protein